MEDLLRNASRSDCSPSYNGEPREQRKNLLLCNSAGFFQGFSHMTEIEWAEESDIVESSGLLCMDDSDRTFCSIPMQQPQKVFTSLRWS